MESKHETPSVILKLMGLDEVPPQHPVTDTQKVLSEKYLQKVASIGVRKKRSSRRHHSFRMSTYEKEESEDALEVVKTIRRDKNHNPSKGNGKENPFLSGTKVKGVWQNLLDASYMSDNGKPETVVDAISSFNFETSMNSGRMAEQGNLQLQQKRDNGLLEDVHGEAGLYETFRFSKSQLDLKDETLNSRIAVLKANPGKGGNGLKYFSFPSSCKNSDLADGVLKEIFCPKVMRVYPEMKDRKRMSYDIDFGKQSSRSLSKVSEEVSTRTGNVANKVISDGTMTKDNLFQKYWGLRKNASANWPTLKSKYQNINQNDYLEDMIMNHRSSSEKSPSFSSYFNSNHTEENCIGLHKLKKRCYGNDLSDKKAMLPQLRSGPSPTFIDSQILQETCLRNDEAKNYKHEDSNMSKQNSASPNSSVDCLVSDAKIEVVGRKHINPTKQQSESTAFVWLRRDNDSLNHSSHASMQQDTSEFQEDSVYSLCSGTEPDSLGSFEVAYEPSPVSVLDLTFREDISSSSECLEVVGASVYGSSEVDDEGFGLNVSSDEDCGDESVGDFKEKQDLVGLFRAEESRDFSYVVEVLTEAGDSNRSLFTNFSTWHSAECPISPSVFEILEKKFGEQQLWKRSERRLLFDRINLGLLEILQPCSYIPTWEKPVSRRLNDEPIQDMIEEEMWGLLVAQEKEASKKSEDKMLGGEIRWTELGDDTEVIVCEIVKLLIEELANEIVSLENF